MKDDTDYGSDGWGSDVKTLLKWNNDVEMVRKKSATTDTEDPGQAKIRQAADKFDEDAQIHIRWYDRTGTGEAYEGWCTPT